jgi:hypothetical protein
MLAEKNAEMGKAVTIIKRLSGSARERRIAEIEELARMDAEANLRGAYNSGEAQGMEKGIDIGIAKGMEKGIYRIRAGQGGGTGGKVKIRCKPASRGRASRGRVAIFGDIHR